MKKLFLGLAAVAIAGCMAGGPSRAASLAADAAYLQQAAGSTSAVSPRRAARGYIATQAAAMARNPAFKRAVSDYARGKDLATVLREASRGGPQWLSRISNGSLIWQALVAAQKQALARQYAARSAQAEGKLTAKQRKGRELDAAQKKLQQEIGRAGQGGLGAVSVTTLLAVFLALNTQDPEGNSEVAQAVAAAANKLEQCLSSAASQRQSCLSASANLYQNAVCESEFAAASLACLSQ